MSFQMLLWSFFRPLENYPPILGIKKEVISPLGFGIHLHRLSTKLRSDPCRRSPGVFCTAKSCCFAHVFLWLVEIKSFSLGGSTPYDFDFSTLCVKRRSINNFYLLFPTLDYSKSFKRKTHGTKTSTARSKTERTLSMFFFGEPPGSQPTSTSKNLFQNQGPRHVTQNGAHHEGSNLSRLFLHRHRHP